MVQYSIHCFFHKMLGTFHEMLGTYQYLFCRFTADDVRKVSKISGADFTNVKKWIDTKRRKSLQKNRLSHFFSNQRSHFAKELEGRKE